MRRGKKQDIPYSDIKILEGSKNNGRDWLSGSKCLILPPPGEAKATAMPGRLYIQTNNNKNNNKNHGRQLKKNPLFSIPLKLRGKPFLGLAQFSNIFLVNIVRDILVFVPVSEHLLTHKSNMKGYISIHIKYMNVDCLEMALYKNNKIIFAIST